MILKRSKMERMKEGTRQEEDKRCEEALASFAFQAFISVAGSGKHWGRLLRRYWTTAGKGKQTRKHQQRNQSGCVLGKQRGGIYSRKLLFLILFFPTKYTCGKSVRTEAVHGRTSVAVLGSSRLQSQKTTPELCFTASHLRVFNTH